MNHAKTRWRRSDITLEPGQETPLVLREEHGWCIPNAGGYEPRVSVSHEYEYSGDLMMHARITLRLPGQRITAVTDANPNRVLAFRDRVTIKISTRAPDRVILTFNYAFPWKSVEDYDEEVKLDMMAIRAWCDSLPAPDPVPAVEVATT